jgi:hypothetical protein
MALLPSLTFEALNGKLNFAFGTMDPKTILLPFPLTETNALESKRPNSSTVLQDGFQEESKRCLEGT